MMLAPLVRHTSDLVAQFWQSRVLDFTYKTVSRNCGVAHRPHCDLTVHRTLLPRWPELLMS